MTRSHGAGIEGGLLLAGLLYSRVRGLGLGGFEFNMCRYDALRLGQDQNVAGRRELLDAVAMLPGQRTSVNEPRRLFALDERGIRPARCTSR